MADMLEHEAITEALSVIDESLVKLAQREIMSSSEVSDLLLDVRLVLAEAAEREPVAN
jgi:hypothetical protein